MPWQMRGEQKGDVHTFQTGPATFEWTVS
jgi:hypothetical protein